MSDDPTLAAIEQRVAAATPGPWTVASDTYIENPGRGPIATTHSRVHVDYRRADAEFIAHARADVPYLLDRLRATEAAHTADYAEQDDRIGELQRQVADVRALHTRVEHPSIPPLTTTDGEVISEGEPKRADTCIECKRRYPCPTIRALDSAQHDPDRTPLGETISGLGTGAEPMSPQDNPDGAQQ